MQDNDPKHTSRRAKKFFEDNINWWRTPPGSPDANPIENLWHELKVHKNINPLNTKIVAVNFLVARSLFSSKRSVGSVRAQKRLATL